MFGLLRSSVLLKRATSFTNTFQFLVISRPLSSKMSPIAPYAAEHAELGGAGDSRPTAMQIVDDQGLRGKLSGKVCLVTGCSSGIGVETARAFDSTGAKVFITVRDTQKGQEVLKEIADNGGSGTIQMLDMDLTSFDSIRKAADDFLSMSSTLNILVNNAGVMACPEGTTKDGFEMQFGTNHLGHFLLFQILKPTLLASSTAEFPSRVVSVSSTAHRHPGPEGTGPLDLNDLRFEKRGYEPWLSYGQAKVSNIHFATELERRYGGQGLHAFSLHPGGIWTPLQRHQPGMEKFKSNPDVQKYMKNTEQGAATQVWAALAKELAGTGGIYLEDCQQADAQDPSQRSNQLSQGYAPWAYNSELEKALWKESLTLVGMKDDQ